MQPPPAGPTPGAAYPPAPYPPVSQGPPASAASTDSTNSNTITQEHLLLSLKSAVEDAVRRKLRDDYAVKNGQLQNLAKIKADLTSGQNQLERALAQLDKESDNLDEAIKQLKVEEQNIKSALDRAKEVSGGDGEGGENGLNPDDAIDTTTPLYRQLLNAHAEEAAIQEAIYYLGEALKHDIIDCDVFLKQVRKMARKQFRLKATMNKCRQTAGLPV